MPHADPEERRAAAQRWRERTREARRAYAREYRAKNKGKTNEYQRLLYKSNISDKGLSDPRAAKTILRKRNYVKAWRKENPSKARKHVKVWRKKHPEKRGVQNKRYRDRYPDKGNVWYNKRRDLMATRPRPDRCELCGTVGKVVFDHDHETNKFRSWACMQCNSAMGWARDNSAVLRRMAYVIDEHRRQHNLQLQRGPDTP